ncbi:MAG: hypothetical protein JW876_08565 [Candidatus Krumholzibacteriota bacterium]|nr:hypothetical protein [Candidatus Krumholzibacteriota bacterium]
MTRPIGRTMFILLLIGAFVSAQQARANESVFSRAPSRARNDLSSLVVDNGPDMQAVATATWRGMPPDTVETYDIELEEDEGPGLTKEIVMFAIIAAVVGYMIVTLIQPDDDETSVDDGGSGKPTPTATLAIPFVR